MTNEVEVLRDALENLIIAIKFECPPIADGVDAAHRAEILLDCAKEARLSAASVGVSIASPQQPRPNFTTLMTLGALGAWVRRVITGEWTWTRNSQCKYVSVHIDTRSGVYNIKDRDGNSISEEELLRQYKAPTK